MGSKNGKIKEKANGEYKELIMKSRDSKAFNSTC